MKRLIPSKTICLLILILIASAAVVAQTNQFAFLGNLGDNVMPANGSYDFKFLVFYPLNTGNQIGSLRGWDGKPKTADTVRNKRLNQQSDLKIEKFLFPPADNKAVRVRVVNMGESPSEGCRLILMVRKIKGVAVSRRTHVNVPVLAAGAGTWLVINAKSVLPNNVSLESTAFTLNVDGTDMVAESDEQNNEVSHGLSSDAVLSESDKSATEPEAPATEPEEPATEPEAPATDPEAPATELEAPATEPETSATEQLSAAPSVKKKRGCLNVGRRWLICGSTNFKNKFVVGGGIRFSKIDPNGRVLVSRTYENCSKLAGDKTIPASIRTKAAAPCEESLKLAVKKAAVQ